MAMSAIAPAGAVDHEELGSGVDGDGDPRPPIL
jgi:hypothetical protein